MAARLKVQIDRQILQDLLRSQSLTLQNFSCLDADSKQEVKKIYGDAAADALASMRLLGRSRGERE